MAAIDDDDAEFDSSAESNEEFEAELARQVALVPPELYEAMTPLLLLGSVANYMLMGHDEDPVPVALTELLDYDMDAVQRVANVNDTPSLARVMATHSLELFDFVQIARQVYESPLDAPLRTYLGRYSAAEDGFEGPRQYLLDYGESLLENIGNYLAADDADLREELRMRRLQTESIFSRLHDTLRPYYPPGHSPEEERAAALDAADEAEDAEDPAVQVSFTQVQRVMLALALRLPYLLAGLGETPFARALADVPRFRAKALTRLADRVLAAEDEVPVALAWSELLRLYQAAHVCALSTVADVSAVGSLEDFLVRDKRNPEEPPEVVAENARHTREVLTAVMAGFVELIETNHPDDEDVTAAKDEISQLAELLLE
jgi:hypothetical protein